MTIRRFHVDDLSHERIPVRGDQARHAVRVLRLKAGDPVVLFDGSGLEAHGTIESTRSDSFVVRIQHRTSARTPSEPMLILAVAPPKGNRADWLVEKCAELGVAALQPLLCERGIVAPGPAKIERWRRKAIEAAKQARRSVPMKVASPLPLNECLKDTCAAAKTLFGDPDPSHPLLLELLDSQKLNTTETVAILIGPEGGFSPDERARIERNAGQAVRLNTGILRVETAAIVAAALWMALSGIRSAKESDS